MNLNQQQYLIKARERYSRFYNILFFSELTMVRTTMYDCDVDLNATMAEKIIVAKKLADQQIDLEIETYGKRWFSKRKIHNLLREKEALTSI